LTCWINFLIEKFAWKPILDAVNDREEGIKTHYFLKMQEKKCKTFRQSTYFEARMERDNMLKDAREIKEKMIADSKDEAQAQGLKMIEQAKAAIESEKMQLWLN
jgi:F-type H+-transporting ATPase subunit b